MEKTDSTQNSSQNSNNNEKTIKEESHYITNKTLKNKQIKVDSFKAKSNHYFIMTEGGTPIYSRYSDENEVASLLATFSAIITKFNYSNPNTPQDIQVISTNTQTTLFLKKGKLYLIGINKGLTTPYKIKNTLELLYLQLVSIITWDRIPLIERKPYSCAEALSGTESQFEQTISYSHRNFPCLVGCYEVLILDKDSRLKIKSILKEFLGEALLCVCLTKQGIIAYSEGSYIQYVHHTDLQLINNVIFANECLSMTESWVPICLPGISDCGYLQMYCNFIKIEGDISVGFVFITESQENKYFMNFCEQTQNIFEKCVSLKLFKEIPNDNDIGPYYEEENSRLSIKDETISNSVENKGLSDFEKNKDLDNQPISNMNEQKPQKLLPTTSIKLRKKEIVNNYKIETESQNFSKLHNAFIYRRRKCQQFQQENYDNDEVLFDDFVNKLMYSYTKQTPISDLFDETTYLACRHKIQNQCFTKGFSDYDKISDDEKKILKSFTNLYESYLNTDKKNLGNFFVCESSKFTSSNDCLIESEQFLLFASFSMFKEVDEIHQTLVEIGKQIKHNMPQYFILDK